MFSPTPAIRLVTVVSRPFEQNTYVAWFDGHDECIIVDPGFEPRLIVDAVDSNRLRPAALLITHGHSDHIAGNAAMKLRWPDCPIVIGENEVAKLSDPVQNLSKMFGAELTSPPADKTLADGERYSAAGFEFLVREIPGHSSGHVVFVWEAGRPIVVFGGDVLFAGSVGRTDIPDGDFDLLARGIRDKLYGLPDDTIVLPGHGQATTTGDEKRTNPFVRGN